MNALAFALRRPVSLLVLVVSLAAIGLWSLVRMPRDVFPDLGVPTIYVAQPYGGMDPSQMEGYLTNYYEYHFLYVNGIEHVESKSIQGVSLIKLQFHPGTDMARAMAETVAYVNRSRAFMPPGTIPPFITRFDAGSVPVGNLVFYSDDPALGLKDLQDAALFRVRPLFATLPGVSAPPPFGGSPRTIVLRADPDRLRALALSPDEIVQALVKGNTISPSGNVRIGDQIPMVPVNSVAPSVAELGRIAVRSDGTRTISIRDVATIEDSADIQTGFALVNGRRTVYIPVTKRADASTMSVVALVKENLERFQSALPDGVRVSYEFDQSPYVTRAIEGLAQEGALGALLTGLMVLVFLRDWRSALVVVLNIPLALVAASLGLYLTGHTINIMTLGGMALAVGILVDEATVTIENVHAHLARGRSLSRAALDATQETALPRLLAMLCILAVFLPALFMQGAARSLFVPLALAVGFSMVASYVLSSTLVPVLAVALVRGGHSEEGGAFARLRSAYQGLTARIVGLRWLVVPVYLAACAAVLLGFGPGLGREIFPLVDAGQLSLRMRAPAGTRVERTEELARSALELIARETGGDGVAISMGFVGVQPGAYPVNTIHLWTSGPEEAVLQVQLRPGVAHVEELKERLRERFSAEFPQLRVAFEPSDIVSRVMSFGAPTPVQVAVSGPDVAANRRHAEAIVAALRAIPTLRDVGFEQSLEYPSIRVELDRERIGQLGLTVDQAARSLAEATSSSRYTAANYWADPKSGVAYQVQLLVPEQRMDSVEAVRNIPVAGSDGRSVSLRQVAEVTEGQMPGQFDRYNMQRMLTIGANVVGEDLGRAAARVEEALKNLGEPPPKVSVTVRGQVAPMRELFDGLGAGLGVAIAAIVLLIAANFQSLRVASAILLTIPAVIAGSVLALHWSGTTLNIQSFMGTIMAIGVAVANSILLATFVVARRRDGLEWNAAAPEGAASRLRAILMTSFAMIAGMVPMAIGHGDGGEQTAPLGRAVIGGLTGSTLATLLILPALLVLFGRRGAHSSGSLHPDDEAPRADSPRPA
ncbi:MAG: efflux RND transporter permease subunit [Planctomycetaceae bacterium]|nr:efflux RND transporter permease subunit [Planctomycetaceae bacterium]